MAIDPGDLREAQHRNWDSAAVGWMEWSEFNDRADRHVSERLVELAGAGFWTSPPVMASRCSPRAQGRAGGARRGHRHLRRDARVRA